MAAMIDSRRFERLILRWLLHLAIRTLPCTFAIAPVADAAEADTSTPCMDKEATISTADLDLRIESRQQDGFARELAMTLLWRRNGEARDELLMRVDAPPAYQGSAILARETGDARTEVYTYVPELRSVRRMSGNAMKGAIFNTDLTYEDALYLFRLSGGRSATVLPGERLGALDMLVYLSAPRRAERSAYASVKSWFDAGTCALRRLHFLNTGGAVIKTIDLAAAEPGREEQVVLPRTIIVRDLENDSETRIARHEARTNVKIPDHAFSVSGLARGR